MSESRYPHEVEIIKELVGAKEVKETHISYALLTDDYVYKIKKSVDFGFLDYTQSKDRKRFCILEKELNERFSKDIYLQVLKLVKTGKSSFSLEPIESSLFAIEYLVKMKRINDNDFLQNRIDNGKIDEEGMVAVGKSIAELLSKLDTPFQIDDDNRSAYEVVKFNVDENFAQTKEFVGTVISQDIYDFLKIKSTEFLEENADIFNKRFDDKFVKDGHGDLRLDHIYFDKDNNVGLIDCIEFNRRFRYNDIISEAGFLSMELDSKGLVKYSDLFLKGFLSVINDDISLKLLNFYRSYLAYVRAKVTIFQILGVDTGSDFYQQKIKEVHKLLHLSVYYLSNLIDPTTLLTYGLMGTGKTANALSLSKYLPYNYISSDVVRKELADMEITERAYLDYNAGIYSKESSYKVYERMADIVNEKLRLGRTSVIDASFTDKRYYDIIRSAIKTSFFNIRFTAPDETIMERLKSRLTKSSISDGRPAIYNKQKETATFPEDDITIETTGNIYDNTKRIFKEFVKRCKRTILK